MFLASSQDLGSDAGIGLETARRIHTPVDTPQFETDCECPVGEQCTVHKVEMGSKCEPPGASGLIMLLNWTLISEVINEVME
jgi:hypothetical protein